MANTSWDWRDGDRPPDFLDFIIVMESEGDVHPLTVFKILQSVPFNSAHAQGPVYELVLLQILPRRDGYLDPVLIIEVACKCTIAFLRM
jgi:hypothetical protein